MTGTEIFKNYEYENIIRTHEKRAKKEIVKEKVDEYVAMGIDKEIAKTMANVFYDYNI